MNRSLQMLLDRQVDEFINVLEAFNKKKQFPHPDKNYIFLRDFYKRFLSDRNKRSDEIESVSYMDVVEKASSLFPSLTLWNLCMDGRVLAVLVNGASAGVGSSIRVPGGILREFVLGDNGKLQLIENSNFAKLLTNVLLRQDVGHVYEVYDSHIGCSARKREENSHGDDPSDMGLFADVIYKSQMAYATIAFVKKHFGESKRVTPLQTSFEPRTGFMYMGLETAGALDYARKNGAVYSHAVLEQIIKEGLIISTEAFLEISEVKKAFEKYAFTVDWKKDYLNSAREFWDATYKLIPEVGGFFEKKVLSLYPELNGDCQDAKDDLKERTLLLLTNCFSGFLHNRVGSVHGNVLKTQTDEHPNYPYGIHREEGVKVSEGGYPPYSISMFVVFSMDYKNLPLNIELAASLVRTNRLEGRVMDTLKVFSDSVEFSRGPVPVVVQEIVREPLMDAEWEALCKLEWSDLPKDWDLLEESEFLVYLEKKYNMSVAAAVALNRLRERMAILYDPDQPTSSHLVEQYKVALPVVVGKNRRSNFIVPFVKLGY